MKTDFEFSREKIRSNKGNSSGYSSVPSEKQQKKKQEKALAEKRQQKRNWGYANDPLSSS